MQSGIFRKAALTLVVIMLVLATVLLAVTLPEGDAEAAVLKRGSTGSDVRTMQQKLKNWGYYSGSVDGIFGSGTESAVKLFQRTNGLTADGIVGSATAAELGMTLAGGTSSGGGSTSSGVLKRGSSGADVKTMQQKLKSWGYYSGSVDGIFGSGTESAVKLFQRTNGLTADGIVGSATAAALGMTLTGGTSSGGSSTSSDLNLLARVVYGEARGEEYVGQVAVAAVVLNRVKSSSFPNTIAGVVYQAGAFDCVADGQINLSPDSTAMKAAQDALNGWDPTYGCLFYYNPRTATSAWMLSRPVKLVIGEHNFC